MAESESPDAPASAEASVSEDAFTDSLGVNVHLNYTDGAYVDLDRVAKDLDFLGIHHVRTHEGGETVAFEHYEKLARAGLKYTFIVPWDRITKTIDFAERLEKRVPGSVVAIEGFNEIDNWPVVYRDLQGEEAARAAQAFLYSEVRKRDALNGIPVLHFTGSENVETLSAMSDIANIHSYNNNGMQPGHFIKNGLNKMKKVTGASPIMNTEFGNITIPPDWPASKPYWANHTELGVDQDAQAKMILNGYFEGIALGVKRTYVYELLDQKVDPAGKEPQFHFGLFTFRHEPKKSAKALRNLTQFLENTRKQGRHDPVKAMLKPPIDGIGSIEIRRSDNSAILALWSRAEFWRWDQHSSEPVEPDPVNVSIVTTSAEMKVSAKVFDPMTNIEEALEINPAGEIGLTVPEYPILVLLESR